MNTCCSWTRGGKEGRKRKGGGERKLATSAPPAHYLSAQKACNRFGPQPEAAEEKEKKRKKKKKRGTEDVEAKDLDAPSLISSRKDLPLLPR